jgi:hypothetical protein
MGSEIAFAAHDLRCKAPTLVFSKNVQVVIFRVGLMGFDDLTAIVDGDVGVDTSVVVDANAVAVPDDVLAAGRRCLARMICQARHLEEAD